MRNICKMLNDPPVKSNRTLPILQPTVLRRLKLNQACMESGRCICDTSSGQNCTRWQVGAFKTLAGGGGCFTPRLSKLLSLIMGHLGAGVGNFQRGKIPPPPSMLILSPEKKIAVTYMYSNLMYVALVHIILYYRNDPLHHSPHGYYSYHGNKLGL